MAMDGPWRMCSAPARRARRPSNSKLGLGDLVYIVSNTDSINTAGGCNVFGIRVIKQLNIYIEIEIRLYLSLK